MYKSDIIQVTRKGIADVRVSTFQIQIKHKRKNDPEEKIGNEHSNHGTLGAHGIMHKRLISNSH